MGNLLSRVDVYNQDYVSLNHSYVEIYKFYNRLLETSDADEDVLSIIREILLVFNPTLDKIKSEMTVKTRFKEETSDSIQTRKQSEIIEKNSSNLPVILHGDFTGE